MTKEVLARLWVSLITNQTNVTEEQATIRTEGHQGIITIITLHFSVLHPLLYVSGSVHPRDD